MLTPIEADRHLAALLKASDARKYRAPAPHWSLDSGACFTLMTEQGCYPFMLSRSGTAAMITVGGTGQPFTLAVDDKDDEAALRYSIVMAVIRKLEIAGVRAPSDLHDDDTAAVDNPTVSQAAASSLRLIERLSRAANAALPSRSYTAYDLLKLVGAQPAMAAQVGADTTGQPFTNYDALLWSAHGPAAVRIVNLAATRYASQAPSPVSADQMGAIAGEAIAQNVDYDFAKPPQPMTDYGLLTDPGQYTYRDHVLKLINLVLEQKAPAPSQQH